MKFTSLLDDFIKTYAASGVSSRFFLGFSCGIPFLLTLTILDIWLKDQGVSNTVIGLFTLLHWPFTLKFMWAPFVESFDFPYLSKKFGRRRGWAVASQFLLFAGLIGMAHSDPKTSMLSLMCFTSLVAFGDGLQDLSLYAYQINNVNHRTLGPSAGVFLFGYRTGMFFAKSISLYLAHYFGWHFAYCVMAFSVFFSMFFVFSVEEPKFEESEADQIPCTSSQLILWKFAHVVKSTIYERLLKNLHLFKNRENWRKYLLLVLIFKAGDIAVHKMAKPFFIDIGFSMLEIANVVQVFGTVSTLIGGILGGYFVKKYGLKKLMFYSAIAHAVASFTFIIMSKIGYNIGFLYFSTLFENITGGIMTTAYLAFLYSMCEKGEHFASQYALLWAFYDFSGIFCRTISGMLADLLGWTLFFSLISITFIPSLVVLYSLITKHERKV